MICNLIRRIVGAKGRPDIVRDMFRKHIRSYESFLHTAEQRAIAIAPEKEPAWRIAFGLQRSLNERRALRFEYLLGRDNDALLGWRMLADIEQRLDEGWSEKEERSLMQASSHYAELCASIGDLRANLHPSALRSHWRYLEQDREYCHLRSVLANRAHAAGNRMGSLLQRTRL